MALSFTDRKVRGQGTSGTHCYVTQSGNNQQDVFYQAPDREVYLDLVREISAEAAGARLLMSSHVHSVLVQRPARPASLTKRRNETVQRAAPGQNRQYVS